MKKYGWAVLIVAIAALALFLTCRPPFIVTNSRVFGAYYVPQRDVENTLGTLVGRPIWFAWIKCEIRKRAILKNPQVESVDVHLHFPDQISISVKEHRPWISFLAGDRHYMVAENGCILNRKTLQVRMSDVENTLIIRGVPIDRFAQDQLDPYLLADVKFILDSIRQVIPTDRFQIEFLDDNHYILYKDDTLPIKLGRLEEMNRKMKNLRRFLASDPAADPTKFDYIDLSMPDRVVVGHRE